MRIKKYKSVTKFIRLKRRGSKRLRTKVIDKREVKIAESKFFF